MAVIHSTLNARPALAARPYCVTVNAAVQLATAAAVLLQEGVEGGE
jgi:hypothetical protein